MSIHQISVTLQRMTHRNYLELAYMGDSPADGREVVAEPESILPQEIQKKAGHP